MEKIKLIKPLLETAFVFSLLCWLYVIAMQIAHPESVAWGLASWLPIRLDYFGEVCFVIAVVSFLLWRMIKGDQRLISRKQNA